MKGREGGRESGDRETLRKVTMLSASHGCVCLPRWRVRRGPVRARPGWCRRATWQSVEDPVSGDEYWWNTETGVTQWETPEEVLEARAPAREAWMGVDTSMVPIWAFGQGTGGRSVNHASERVAGAAIVSAKKHAPGGGSSSSSSGGRTGAGSSVVRVDRGHLAMEQGGLIGRGVSGEVLRATVSSEGCEELWNGPYGEMLGSSGGLVAVKRVRKGVEWDFRNLGEGATRGRSDWAAFVREAGALGVGDGSTPMRHGILGFIGWSEDPTYYYGVMPLAQWNSFGDIQGSVLDHEARWALEACLELVDALQSLHRVYGRLHGDLHCNQVVAINAPDCASESGPSFGPAGRSRPRLCFLDLGRSVAVDSAAKHKLVPADQRANFQLGGVHEHVAPELVTGGTYSVASDVYALGVLLLRCLRGWGGPAADRLLADLQQACLATDPGNRRTLPEIRAMLHSALDESAQWTAKPRQ